MKRLPLLAPSSQMAWRMDRMPHHAFWTQIVGRIPPVTDYDQRLAASFCRCGCIAPIATWRHWRTAEIYSAFAVLAIFLAAVSSAFLDALLKV